MGTPRTRVCERHGTKMRRYKNRGREDWAQWHCSTCDAETKRAWYAADPRRRMLQHIRARARQTNLPFSLTLDDIVIPEFCPVLGLKLTKNDRRGARETSPSVDRHRPALGYVPSNVTVISWRANRLRNDATLEELEKIVAYVRGLQ